MSSLSTTKYGEKFSVKHLCMGEDFLRQIYGGMFDMDANDQIMEGRKFARVKLVFHSLTLIWVIDILFETLTPQIGN